MKVVWTDRALREVAATFAYQAAENAAAATRLADRLLHAGDALALHPRLGRPADGGRRLLVVERFVLIYRLVGDEVRILRVVHGSRRRYVQ